MEQLKLEQRLIELRITEKELEEKTHQLKEELDSLSDDEAKAKKVEIYDTREQFEECQRSIIKIRGDLAPTEEYETNVLRGLELSDKKDGQLHSADALWDDSRNQKFKDSKSYVRAIKPHKYRKDDDILIFLERFGQFVIVNKIMDKNLDILLLTLIEDDFMYKRIRSIKLTSWQKSDVECLIKALKDGLYPATEARILRSTVSRMKQNSGENIEHFTQRIEDASERAFLNPVLREEACLSALIEGVIDGEIKRKLMEDEVGDFETAARMAKKLERIGQAVNREEKDWGLEGTGLEAPVYRLEEQGSGNCGKCGKPGHKVEDCWQDVTCQLCDVKGHVARVCRRNQGRQGFNSNYKFPWRGSYRGAGRARGSRFNN